MIQFSYVQYFSKTCTVVVDFFTFYFLFYYSLLELGLVCL